MSDLTPAGFVRDLELVGAEPGVEDNGIMRSRCPGCRSDKPLLLIDQRDGLTICCTASPGCDDVKVVNAVLNMKTRGQRLKPTPPPPGRLFSEIKPGPPVVWLWKTRIPAGAVSLVEGDSEKAKTTLLIDIAARITTASPLPFEED